MWEEGGHFGASAAAVKGGGEPYVIVIPPPNVTSVLHMGHGLNNTIQDVLIRWRKLQGYNTLWMPGVDHAGIGTEIIMERNLADKGTSRDELGREKFTSRMWNWKAESPLIRTTRR